MEKTALYLCLVFSFVILVSTTSQAQQTLVGSIAEGCKQELIGYCNDVTPGQSRTLACLYAHGDKLSNKCEYALYDAAIQLERAVSALSYAANECGNDLDKFCMDMRVGEGRLVECLDKNESEVSTRCKEALKEVGIK